MSNISVGLRLTTTATLIWFACQFSNLPASSQTVTLSPSCGVAGKTTVAIKGSGWAEPSPPCRYLFSLDGTSVAPDQQDGLFGPPNSSFVVPAGASAGNKTFR